MNDQQEMRKNGTEDVLARVEPRPVGLLKPVASVEEIVEAEKIRENVVKAILRPEHIVYLDEYGHGTDEKHGVVRVLRHEGYLACARAFGLDWVVEPGVRTVGEDREGAYYVWQYACKCISPSGHRVSAIGVCSSRKPFFSKKAGQRVDPKEENIALNAQTVAISRAIGRMVGVTSPSLEEFLGELPLRAQGAEKRTPERGKSMKATEKELTAGLIRTIGDVCTSPVFSESDRAKIQKSVSATKTVKELDGIYRNVLQERKDREAVLKKEAEEVKPDSPGTQTSLV